MTKRKAVTIIQNPNKRVKTREMIARQVSVPVVQSVITRLAKPTISRVSDGSFMIKGTELFNFATTQTTFTASAGAVIPAQMLFLGGIAQNFSRWKWHTVRFVYIPLCATSVQGLMSFAFNYDFVDTLPTTDQQMSTLKGYTATPAWGGSEGSVMLNRPEIGVVPGAVYTDLDLKSRPCPFTPFTTTTKFNALTAQDKLLYGHAQFISAASNAGVSQTAGVIYIQYACEVTEPTASATQ